MKPLNQSQLDAYRERPIRVLQFGGGNFLRAFTDWMIDRLNEETEFDGRVALVKPTPSGDYEQLRQQDGLYHVLIRGYKAGAVIDDHRLIRSIAQIIHPYRQWQDYLRTAEIPTVRFVFSNTTEAGIRFNPEDQFEDQPPRRTDRGLPSRRCPAPREQLPLR